MKRMVVCAAVRDEGGNVICSPRHFDALMHETMSCKTLSGRLEQGFVDQKGEFMSREEALIVALAANQIVRRCGGDEDKLFSENLY